MTLGVPVLNRPDLLEACLRSIDIPVRLVIIDNGGVTDEIQLPDDAWVVQPPSNLGVAASWNFIIRTAPADPYWLIANADVEFGPGDLARLCAEMEKGGPRWVGINNDWRLMGLTSETVEQVGFFDENLHPIYFEDCDYEYRCALAGVPWYSIDGATTHVGSAAIKSEERYARANARTYEANRRYYLAKWGGPHRGGERFRLPFNDAGGHVRDWALDLKRLRDNAWD